MRISSGVVTEGSSDRSFTELLDPGEVRELSLETRDADIFLTDRRLVVVANERVRLVVAYREIRRIAFDVEPRQGTLVIVPTNSVLEAQVLWVTPEQLSDVGRILALVGERMAA